MHLQTLKILKEWEPSYLAPLIDWLNQSGMASDEDNFGLSSTMIENWSSDCDRFLRENGYEGGELLTIGEYFNWCGAIYALFDSERVSVEQAKKYLKLVANQHRHN